MSIVRRRYPSYSLNRRRKLAGSIVGGLRANKHVKKRRK